MTATLVDELRSAIARSSAKPLIVCGSGVSMQASGGRTPSWAGLISSGVDQVAKLDSQESAWAAYAHHRLQDTDIEAWLAVADELTAKLGGSNNAEFRSWLKSQVGNASLATHDLVNAILGLDCPIATTNFDELLTIGTGLRPISWLEYDDVHRFLTGQEDGILHLHGYWRDTTSIVLGRREYDANVADQRKALLQQMSALSRPTIFIGCGPAGLADPDFSNLGDFIEIWQAVAERRYWLVATSSVPASAARIDHARRIYPVVYGVDFRDLPKFLEDLAPIPTDPVAATGDVRCVDQHEPKPLLFGREAALDHLISALTLGTPAIIAGGPGIGKSALATAALYDASVVKLFGRNRVFISLETASEARAMLARLAEALALPSVGDGASILRSLEIYSSAHRTAAVLDNAEGIFEADRNEAERAFQLLGQLAGISIILTIRGIAPSIPGAAITDDLATLPPQAAKDAFLAVAGQGMKGDPDLPHLLEVLDGHALSIQLVAAQALGLPDLSGIRENWEDLHAEILRKPGVQEDRLTSVRASLALSLQSMRLQRAPWSKRLLALLAYLPAGLAQSDVPKILGKVGLVSRARVNELVAPLHQLRLIERRIDRRLRMLTPLRESVKLQQKLFPDDRKRLFTRYLKIADSAQSIGTMDWKRVQAEVESESDNLDPVCLEAVNRDISNRYLLGALLGLEQLYRFVGKGDIQSLVVAAPLYISKGEKGKGAAVLNALARIYLDRDDRNRAMRCYEEALHLAVEIGNSQIQANCTAGIGRVKSNDSDQAAALSRFSEAIRVYEQSNDKLGEANVLCDLAIIDFQRGDFDGVRTLLRRAEDIYLEIHHVLGVAHCKVMSCRLPDADLDGLLTKANDIFRAVGDRGGMAAVLRERGEFAERSGDIERAISLFREIVEITLEMGESAPQEYVLARLGRALLRIGDFSGASDRLHEAFSMYFARASAADLARSGWDELYKSFYALSDDARGNSLGRARQTWSAIGRKDLVSTWLDDEIWLKPFTLPAPANQ